MACACKVNQQLTFLQKKYGTNIPVSKTTNIRGKVRATFRKVVLAPFILIASPIIFVYVVLHKGPITIDKVLKININGSK